jgi:hypothetical protein
MVERNMCNAVMRGTVIPSGSKSTSRANGLRRSLGKSLPSIPKMRAVCGKAARTDLSGGREATRVPTATTESPFHLIGPVATSAFGSAVGRDSGR